ncbi:MAG: GMC family oxidoreductase N-terminal domain-containing protein [Gemmatimonadales bacterium]
MSDIVVVGAGSAGAVIASRLSEDPGVAVTLLEAGPARVPRESRIPAAFSRLFRTSFDWRFETEPESELDGRRLYWPRGRMLGGSSAMNAMIWTRPAREDFARWVAAGAAGWSYPELEPFFDRAELPDDRAAIGVPIGPLRSPSPLVAPFLAACAAMGLPPNDGFGDGRIDGAGAFRVTQRRGARVSTATGYLEPATGRPNLAVVSDALVDRVAFEGNRAVGVHYLDAEGRSRLARGRVVLSGGAIGSPAILLRSGVGPASELGKLGIQVTADLPGVGANLQDHLACGRVYRLRRPVSLAGAGGAGDLLRYLFARRGRLTSNVAEAGAFFSLGDAPVPMLEVLLGAAYFVDHGFGNPEGHGMTLAVVLQHPESRGRVSLRSTAPGDPPVIEARYLSAPADRERLLEGLGWVQELTTTAPLAAEHRGEALERPSADLHLRGLGQTLYHPVGTCRIGTGPDAVVGADLRVLGCEDLWVADASVMPLIPTGHTHAPSVAIGERAAALIGQA